MTNIFKRKLKSKPPTKKQRKWLDSVDKEIKKRANKLYMER